MGKGERSRAEAKANDLSRRQEENRSRTAGEVDESEGAAAEDFLGPDCGLAFN
jgi:hypothetical protein